MFHTIIDLLFFIAYILRPSNRDVELVFIKIFVLALNLEPQLQCLIYTTFCKIAHCLTLPLNITSMFKGNTTLTAFNLNT